MSLLVRGKLRPAHEARAASRVWLAVRDCASRLARNTKHLAFPSDLCITTHRTRRVIFAPAIRHGPAPCHSRVESPPAIRPSHTARSVSHRFLNGGNGAGPEAGARYRGYPLRARDRDTIAFVPVAQLEAVVPGFNLGLPMLLSSSIASWASFSSVRFLFTSSLVYRFCFLLL